MAKLSLYRDSERSKAARNRINDLVDIIPREVLVEMIKEHHSVRGMITGYLGEHLLEEHVLTKIEGVEGIYKPADNGPESASDRTFQYANRTYKVQCKSIATRDIKEVLADETLKATVRVNATDKADRELPNGHVVKTKCCIRGDFDIVAVSTFLFTGDESTFAFKRARDLPEPPNLKDISEEDKTFLITTSTEITWPLKNGWTDDIVTLLDDTLGMPANQLN